MAVLGKTVVVLLTAMLYVDKSVSNKDCLSDERVLRKLFKENSYDSADPPSGSEPVAVDVGVKIQRLQLFPELNQVRLDGFLTRRWTDSRLAFSSLGSCHSAVSGAAGHVWLPPIVFVNGNRHRLHEDAVALSLHKNGTISHSQRLEISAPCSTDALLYPFGNTTCTLIWHNERFSSDRVRLEWDADLVRTPFALVEPIEQINFFHNDIRRSDGLFDELVFELKLNRKPNKIFLLFYLPSLFILFVSWLSLALGPMAITRAVMSVGAFALLFLHYSTNMANLPITTGLTSIDVWKLGTMLFVLASMLELAVVTCMASTGRSRRLWSCVKAKPKTKGKYSMEPVYEELNDLRARRTRSTCSCCRVSALILDCLSLIGFAVAFAAFVFVYVFHSDIIVAFINDFKIPAITAP